MGVVWPCLTLIRSRRDLIVDRNSANWSRDFVKSLCGVGMVTVQMLASGMMAVIRSSVIVGAQGKH